MAPHTPGIGHNSNADYGPGYTGRKYAWAKARAALLPNTLPIEIIRTRVKRAAELGLEYRTYASVRAATGRDIVALLFSTNALRMLRDAQLPADRAAALTNLKATRGALAHVPLDPAALLQLTQIDLAAQAPKFTDSWTQMRQTLCATLRENRLPADGTLLIGDTAFEASWCAAARAAGYLSAARYFGDTA